MLCNGWHANSWEAGNTEQTALIINEDECGTSYPFTYTVTRTPADAAANGYNLRDNEGNLLYDNGGKLYWATEGVTVGDRKAIFVFEEIDGHWAIKSVNTGNYVGPVDNTAGWSWIHVGTNHTGAGAGHLFDVEKLADDYSQALKEEIENAKGLLESTQEGTEPGQYPAESRVTLQNAIAEAEAALEGSKDEIPGAIADLKAAEKTYLNSKVPAVFPEGYYIFHHVALGTDDAVLCNGWQANSWESWNVMSTALLINKSEAGDYNYVFHVTRAPEGAEAQGYNIRDNKGQFLYNSDGNLLFTEETQPAGTEMKTIFLFEEEGDNWKIKCVETDKYVGPVDGTKGWSWIHVGTTHTGTSGANVFRAEAVGASISERLIDAITAAEELLATTEEGTEPGQYSAAARAELQEEIDSAKAALNGTDDEMQEALTYLEYAIRDYKDKVIPQRFVNGEYKFYSISMPGALLCTGYHANSWESWNVEQTALYLNEDEAGEYNCIITVKDAPADADFPGYNLFDNEGNQLYNAGGKLLWGNEMELSHESAIFVFEGDNDNLTIRSQGTGKYVGPVDGTKGWTWIHAGTTHSGENNGNILRAELVKAAAIETVDMDASDNEAPEVYYNLQGIRVLNPRNGIFIRRQGNTTAKVAL